jgi:hypothetical protein
MEGIRQLELACLPTSLEWHIWFQHWKRHVEQKYPWERALVDAVSRLQKNQITLARSIRFEGGAKKMIQYDDAGHVWGEDAKMPDEFTREALVWFLQNIRPVFFGKNGRFREDIPEHVEVLVKAVQGCYLQQARLGIEQTAIKKRGYLTVNASATKIAPTEKEVYDKGMEAFSTFSERDREES